MQKTRTSSITYRMITILFVLALALAPWTLLVAQEEPSEKDAPEATWFIDDTDAGDDPWRGGCHWHYRDKVCSAAKMFFSGDYCDGNFLYEWTNQSCHDAEDDKKRYDCAAECEEKGLSGKCVVVPDQCGNGMDSAVCECG